MSSCSARKTACIGPAPPKAISVNSRGSRPRPIVICADQARHPRIHDLEDPGGERLRLHPELLAEPFERSGSELRVERHSRRRGSIRRSPGRDGRSRRSPSARSPLAVAGRPRERAGAARPDAEAGRRRVGHGSAARPDRVHVDYREEKRLALEHRLARELRLASDDQARRRSSCRPCRRRSRYGTARSAAAFERGECSADGSREQCVHGLAACPPGGRHPAVRLHHVDPDRDAFRVEL